MNDKDASGLVVGLSHFVDWVYKNYPEIYNKYYHVFKLKSELKDVGKFVEQKSKQLDIQSRISKLQNELDSLNIHYDKDLIKTKQMQIENLRKKVK